MSTDPAETLARAIVAAHGQGQCLPSEDHPVDDADAYRVQEHVVANRLGRGQRIAGWKLGYTSKAMRQQMGIDAANFAPLTDRMILGAGERLPESVLHPRVEPEIALVLGRDVGGEHDAISIRGHVASAHACLEIVDSVWCDYRFTWAQNTADGSSAAFVVLGEPLHVRDLARVQVELLVNGVTAGTGLGSDAMGDPFAALAWLNEQLRPRGVLLRARDVVITGGLTPAVSILPGDNVRARFDGAVVHIARAPSGNRASRDESL